MTHIYSNVYVTNVTRWIYKVMRVEKKKSVSMYKIHTHRTQHAHNELEKGTTSYYIQI